MSKSQRAEDDGVVFLLHLSCRFRGTIIHIPVGDHHHDAPRLVHGVRVSKGLVFGIQLGTWERSARQWMYCKALVSIVLYTVLHFTVLYFTVLLNTIMTVFYVIVLYCAVTATV